VNKLLSCWLAPAGGPFVAGKLSWETEPAFPWTLVQHWLWTHESMKLLLISRFASILFFT
jgi:hypothetical protein